MKNGLHSLWLRLKALFKRSALDRDLDDELTFHLAMREQKNRAAGVGTDEAPFAARRAFGNATGIKERTRDMWTFPSLESFWQDVRFAARMLRKNPGFTAVAVLTLAMGIGANAAIFSVINSVLLHPLPFHQPDRLVRIYSAQDSRANLPVSGEDYFDWQKQARSFETMCIYSSPQSFNASGAGEPETVSVDSTQANFFSLLGVPPQVGRAFADGEDRKGNNRVAVLSAGFAARHFGGAADALGKVVRLDFSALHRDWRHARKIQLSGRRRGLDSLGHVPRGRRTPRKLFVPRAGPVEVPRNHCAGPRRHGCSSGQSRARLSGHERKRRHSRRSLQGSPYW